MNDRELADGMFDLTPTDGSSAGNVSLRDSWKQWVEGKGQPAPSADDYWRVRQVLLDDGRVGLGKGKGGSVRRSAVAAAMLPAPPIAPAPGAGAAPVRKGELGLYDPVMATIKRDWAVAELGLPASSFVLCVSAFQGKAKTGGKWSRPDITLVYARRFAYLGPVVEVVTFEVKPFDELAVDGVFEAAAHSSRAHRVYLLAEVPEAKEESFFESDEFDRLETECLRFGVGLATFAKPDDARTWQVHVRPDTHSPDPAEVEAWVAQCFKADCKELHTLIGGVFAPAGKGAN